MNSPTDDPRLLVPGQTGWAYVGGAEHPVVILDVRRAIVPGHAPRYFIAHGTSSGFLAAQLGGEPLTVGPVHGRQYGWPATTHFYPKATTTVSGLARVTGRADPVLFRDLRTLIGW